MNVFTTVRVKFDVTPLGEVKQEIGRVKRELMQEVSQVNLKVDKMTERKNLLADGSESDMAGGPEFWY